MINKYEKEYNELVKKYRLNDNFGAMDKFLKHLFSVLDVLEYEVICITNVDNEYEYRFFKKATNQKWRVSIEYQKQGSDVLEFYEIDNVIKHIFDDCNGRYRLSIRVL